MGKPAFTPGPWAEHIQGEDGKAIGVYAEKGRRSIVHMAIRNPDANANAHLVAAAPTMFDLLTRAQEELRLIHMKDTGATYDITLRLEINAALDKASTP